MLESQYFFGSGGPISFALIPLDESEGWRSPFAVRLSLTPGFPEYVRALNRTDAPLDEKKYADVRLDFLCRVTRRLWQEEKEAEDAVGDKETTSRADFSEDSPTSGGEEEAPFYPRELPPARRRTASALKKVKPGRSERDIFGTIKTNCGRPGGCIVECEFPSDDAEAEAEEQVEAELELYRMTTEHGEEEDEAVVGLERLASLLPLEVRASLDLSGLLRELSRADESASRLAEEEIKEDVPFLVAAPLARALKDRPGVFEREKVSNLWGMHGLTMVVEHMHQSYREPYYQVGKIILQSEISTLEVQTNVPDVKRLGRARRRATEEDRLRPLHVRGRPLPAAGLRAVQPCARQEDAEGAGGDLRCAGRGWGE